jgi:hypothetical protein
MFGNNDKQDDNQQPDLEVPTPDQIDAADDQPAVSTDTDWQHPGAPLNDDKPAEDDKAGDDSAPISDVLSPAGGFPRSTDTQVSSHQGTSMPPLAPPAHDLIDNADPVVNDLVEIRQHALTELAPLLDQLDQLSAEDRFRIIMLVIQAGDDKKLIKEAYEAAHGITDDKVRAQALFDLVNEINYFTQPPEA